jgi:hypothetical protein
MKVQLSTVVARSIATYHCKTTSQRHIHGRCAGCHALLVVGRCISCLDDVLPACICVLQVPSLQYKE